MSEQSIEPPVTVKVCQATRAPIQYCRNHARAHRVQVSTASGVVEGLPTGAQVAFHPVRHPRRACCASARRKPVKPWQGVKVPPLHRLRPAAPRPHDDRGRPVSADERGLPHLNVNHPRWSGARAGRRAVAGDVLHSRSLSSSSAARPPCSTMAPPRPPRDVSTCRSTIALAISAWTRPSLSTPKPHRRQPVPRATSSRRCAG